MLYTSGQEVGNGRGTISEQRQPDDIKYIQMRLLRLALLRRGGTLSQNVFTEYSTRILLIQNRYKK